ncbi:SusC/RagA family TonB-linked outer membrane protein [Chitinophaga sancti]|uniref:SusC/RagA family TonB-linked outer membrane protein n=1 Tax=Chitinophaga sancti TaxID=1004 RepID=A0A1K1RNA3_9BACT|nr:SusC/RagA family TonB-linked outer membrane protein [Chitinophaga sancti]WQD62640.1 SusC/RagA family TonB-linked outer membrane protein [Chitinophaga sancti]WQG91737.1 SusC/RagA family TonB-linked outer membrane protein [Chitinophaga sancti]SFW73292.1 TonB-linked outer membrane protein, SusC/RagA family [Chitinophaga sancti]
MAKHVCSAIGTLCVLCLLLLPSTVLAQPADHSAKVTVVGKHLPLSAIFKSISKQTGYYFVFDNAILDETEKVNAHFRRVPWEHVLQFVLQDRKISWTLLGNRIFLQKPAVADAKPVPAPDTLHYAVRGSIRTDGDQPVPGVTVMLKGSSRGITTGNDGAFELSQLPRNAVLHISSLGFVSLDTVLTPFYPHVIHLREAVSSLDAAVVIGYGASSRRLLTGNVNRVSAQQIGNQPAVNPLTTLQGQIPGLLVMNTNGLPGAEIKVFIRGRNSIAAGNNPLFIVDGVPFDIAPLNKIDVLQGAIRSISPFNSINPADIESVDILKDADATAIYGSRGANGVVLISTKRGKPGPSLLELNVYQGGGRTAGTFNMLNSSQYLAMRRNAFKNDGVIPTAAEAPDLLLWDTTLNMNWQKYLTGGTAPVTNAQLSYAGGDELTTFRLAGNYYRQGSVLPGPLSYGRGGGHFSIQHHDVSQRFEVNSTTLFTTDKNRSISSDLYSLINLPPDYPMHDQNGNFYWGTYLDNPAAYLIQHANSETNNLLSNLVLRYRLLPGFYLRMSGGYARIDMRQLFTFPLSSQDPAFATGSYMRVAENRRAGYIIEPQADYTLRIAKGSLHALVGGTFQRTKSSGQYAEGRGYGDESKLGALSAADTVIRKPDTRVEYRYISFFTRWNYNWQNKYLLNVSYRRDGSSRFGPGKQFGDFGAIGAAWIFSEEPWIKRLNWLSFGKLRVSGGITGNDQIPDYQYMSNYGVNGNYQNNSTLTPLRIANNKYSWEESRKLEAALELGFLQDRFFFALARYENWSSNQLVGYQLPGISGFASYQANLPAVVRNNGWEIELTATNIRHLRFSWKSSLNATFFNNKLQSFPALAGSAYAGTFTIGESLNIVRGFHFLGINPETGVAMFEDVNKDGALSAGNDVVTISNKDPRYYLGLTNDVTFRQFSMSCFLQYVRQQGQTLASAPGSLRNETTDALRRWQQPGDQTDVQRASATPGNVAFDLNRNLSLSNAAYMNASYLRLRNISLAYELPAPWMKQVHLSRCRVYAAGQDLFTISSYNGANPETQLALPPLKIITGGMQLTL